MRLLLSFSLFFVLFKPIDPEERSDIARVINCIAALSKQYMYINDTIVVYTYEGKEGTLRKSYMMNSSWLITFFVL